VKNNIYAYGIRGEGRSATRRAMALMAEKALRCDEDPHPHISAGRSADRAAIRPRAHRGCYQSRCYQPANERDR